jgi:hypothetical protein
MLPSRDKVIGFVLEKIRGFTVDQYFEQTGHRDVAKKRLVRATLFSDPISNY